MGGQEMKIFAYLLALAGFAALIGVVLGYHHQIIMALIAFGTAIFIYPWKIDKNK